MMLEKARLNRSIKSATKANNRASLKVNRRVQSRSLTAIILTNFFKMSVLLFFGFIVIFPFYYMISASLMSTAEIDHTGSDLINVDHPVLIPDEPVWGNYKNAFADGYWAAFFLSISIMVFQIVFKIVVCILMGYAFGKYEFAGKKVIWYIFMMTLMVPEVAILSGQFWVSKHIVGTTNWLSLAICLIGPFTASIFTAYLFRNGFEAIDDSVKEAALIDGVGGFRFFITIAIPMIAPIIWTQIILTALASWNSYMWPSLLLETSGDGQLQTIPMWLFDVGTDGVTGGSKVYTEIKLAGSVIAVVPTMIFYFIFRKRINMTVSGSANKG